MGLAKPVDAQATGDRFAAVVAAWTSSAPDPERCIPSEGFRSAQRAVEGALRSGGDPIVITGARGVGKSLLLRSLWQRPPRGFAAIFVPPSEDAAPEQIAARILAATRSGLVNDAEAGLARLMRTQSLRGLRPMLLVDDVDAMPLATLSELLAITDGSRVEVTVVAAGVPGPELDLALAALAKPIRTIALDNVWTSEDARDLCARITAALPREQAARMTAIDSDALVRCAGGNPLQVRSGLAEELLNAIERPRRVPEFVMQPPGAAGLRGELAKSEPDVTPTAPAPGPAVRLEPPAPAPAGPTEPVQESPPASPTTALVAPVFVAPVAPALEPVRARVPRTTPPRVGSRRRTRDRRLARTFLIALAGCAVLVVLFDRAPSVGVWWSEAVVARAERAAVWIDRARATPPAEEPVRIVVERPAEPAPAPAVAEPAEPVVESPPPVAAPPPIRVAINSDPWAIVEVDGVAAGSTPLMFDMSPGTHHVRVVMADGRIVERQFVAGPGQDRLVFP